MWNPFKAVGDLVSRVGEGIGKVASAVGEGISRATEAVVDAVKAPFETKEQPSAPPPAPSAPPETAAPPAPPTGGGDEPMLPPSMVGGGEGGATEISGEAEEELQAARDNFISDQDLGPGAMDFLMSPNFAQIFEGYITGSGFDLDQWMGGMSNVRDITIKDIGDGMIEVS